MKTAQKNFWKIVFQDQYAAKQHRNMEQWAMFGMGRICKQSAGRHRDIIFSDREELYC